MSGRPWLIVARREFLERVKTRWFAIITVIGPIGMIALVVLPAWLGARQAEERVVVEMVDRSGRDLARAMNAVAAFQGDGDTLVIRAVDPRTSEEELRYRIRDRDIQGYLIVPEDVLGEGEVRYRGDNATNMGFARRLAETVNYAVVALRADDAGLDPTKVQRLLAQVPIDLKQTTGEGAARSALGSYILGYVLSFILYMAIVLYAMNVGRSVVQDKTSRVVEMVASAVRPRPLMVGKVVGVGMVGVLQLSIWGAAGLLSFRYREALLGAFGVTGGGASDLPALGVATFALILVYFVGGFFFFAAIYAAIGAMVNSDQEAQQAQMPVTLLLVVPMVCAQVVAGDPRGTAAKVLTMLPFSSPTLMPLRQLLEGASPVELVVSIAILYLSTAGVVVLAARIYRVGILMYGKRPTLREIGRWMRDG